ncbi:hypothetical protein [Streptomyces macrosporus]|uniref:Uncharacterized protein n=1 Tax=Streptomyces macrosporus TaxID=44032 RepID=A0ABN3J877_9ACTN
MKYVVARWEESHRGFWTDPREYLRRLAEFRDRLPEGARRFATDPAHYDFPGERCVKDLRLSEIGMSAMDVGALRLVFSPNPWKHVSGLVVEYTGVRRVDIVEDEHPWDEDEGYGTVLLDEILPVEGGCSHEFALSGSSVRIECADLDARWLEPSAER